MVQAQKLWLLSFGEPRCFPSFSIGKSRPPFFGGTVKGKDFGVVVGGGGGGGCC